LAGGAERLDRWEDRFAHALRLRQVGKLYALAVEIGVDESAISRWKKGRSISLENAAQVCRALDISLDWLVMGRGSIDAHRRELPFDGPGALVQQAFPDNDNVFRATVREVTATAANWSITVFAVCATAS